MTPRPSGRFGPGGRVAALLWLAALCLGHLLLTLHWNSFGPVEICVIRDEPVHVDGLNRLLVALRAEGPAGLPPFALEINAQYSYLAHLPRALVGALISPAPVALRGANVLYLAVLLAAVYGLGRRLRGPGTGLIAATAVASTPSVFGGMHGLGLDFPALCFTPLAVLLLLRGEGFSRLGPALGFGALGGLGVLLKGQVVFFLVAPAAWALYRGLDRDRRAGDRAALARNSHQPSAAAADSTPSSRPSPSGNPHRTSSTPPVASGARSANLRHSPPPRDDVGEKSGLRRTLRNGALAVATLLLVSAPWWGVRLDFLLRFLWGHTTGETMLFLEGDTTIWGGVVHYLRDMPLLLGGPLTLALLIALVPFLRRAGHRALLLLWIGFPLVLHIVMSVRHFRYLYPLVPALALVIALGLVELAGPRRGSLRDWAVAGLSGLLLGGNLVLGLLCALTVPEELPPPVTSRRDAPAWRAPFHCGSAEYLHRPSLERGPYERVTLAQTVAVALQRVLEREPLERDHRLLIIANATPAEANLNQAVENLRTLRPELLTWTAEEPVVARRQAAPGGEALPWACLELADCLVLSVENQPEVAGPELMRRTFALYNGAEEMERMTLVLWRAEVTPAAAAPAARPR